jgi:hypothetical protein
MNIKKMTRRTFGQTLGLGAVAGTLQGVGATSDQSNIATSRTPTAEALCEFSAIELATRIRQKDVSARDVMAAHLTRIERLNPKVNAIVTLVADRAMADAARADELTARGGQL